MPPRPDPRRIAATSFTLCVHVVLAVALFLPAAPLRRIDHDAAPLVVEVAPVRREVVPPPPPPPRPPAPRSPATRPPVVPAPAPTASATPVGASRDDPAWRFDPSAAPTVVVYGEKPALDLVEPDRPPTEIPRYRSGFDPSGIEGLNGLDAGGSVTFDVLVDESGAPSALVPQQRACTQRAYETAMSVIAQWRFMAGTRGGVPVPAWLTVRIEF